jgi:hypothetical protein
MGLKAVTSCRVCGQVFPTLTAYAAHRVPRYQARGKQCLPLGRGGGTPGRGRGRRPQAATVRRDTNEQQTAAHPTGGRG